MKLQAISPKKLSTYFLGLRLTIPWIRQPVLAYYRENKSSVFHLTSSLRALFNDKAAGRDPIS